MFRVSEASVCKIVTTRVCLLSNIFHGTLLRWPTCEEVMRHFPKSFKKQEWSLMQPGFSFRSPHPHVHRRPHGVSLRFLQSTRRSFPKDSYIYLEKRWLHSGGSYSSSISTWMLGLSKHPRLWQVIRPWQDFRCRFPLQARCLSHWMRIKRQLNHLGLSFTLSFRGCLHPSFLKEGSQPQQLLTRKVLWIPLTFFFRCGQCPRWLFQFAVNSKKLRFYTEKRDNNPRTQCQLEDINNQSSIIFPGMVEQRINSEV